MWSIGYAEMCLSICLYAFWEFWFYNIRENYRSELLAYKRHTFRPWQGPPALLHKAEIKAP